MSTFKTKFVIQETVYWVCDDKVHSGAVTEIWVGGSGIRYLLLRESYVIEESELFASKAKAQAFIDKEKKRKGGQS